MASSSRSASASTSTADGCKYDLFLNHRGPDVKNTFVSHLYNRLTDHRLRVFLDREEIRKGEKITDEIDGAIRASSIHLAIFSPSYCQSPWCLNELLLMLEMKLNKGSTILPIFFHVKPSELRWTEGENGVYAQSLSSLQRKRTSDSQPRYDSNTIGKWKKALNEVAGLSGFELDEAPYNGDEGMLLAAVVERLLEIVPKPPLDVSKYPTGLDDKIKDFEETALLQPHQNGEARIAGIVGLGGVGKTTLTKELFNRERTKYRRSSFLCDVREKASRGSLESLQIQLIKDLSQVDVKINNIHEGISLLKKHLSQSHALIILDDVDHIDQLEALLPILRERDVLNFSGLILVTSRDKSVLTDWGVVDGFIYRLEGLNPQRSSELFCWHAFRQPHAVAGFEQLVNEFLDACKGLPLSLKVIGALLYGKNIEYWKSQLRKISKILPEEIQKTLKISYDSLDEYEKLIFLDIACVFIGRRKETAIRVWEGSGWEGSLALQNLQDKCLVEVKVENSWEDSHNNEVAEYIIMHDHLRDLGRDLASKEPLRRIRFAARRPVSNQLVVEKIKTFPECDHLRLQLPDFENTDVEGIFSVGQSLQLIYLSCYNYRDSSLDSKLSTQNLLALDIRGGNLETLWHLESQAPLKLTHLDIRSCTLSKIPKSIGQLKHLEKVVLRGVALNLPMPLESLPEEFCHIASLKHLELEIGHLSWLPGAFGNMTSLQYVNLSDCGLLEMLPDSFGNLTNLQDLLLIGCDKLQNLPDSFGNLTELQHIVLRLKKLETLPNSFGNLTKLQHINLSWCVELQKLPDSFGDLIKLQHIDLSGCGKLQMLPDSFGNLIELQHINLSRCSKLQMLPRFFGKLVKLQHIDLSRCGELQMLPDSFGALIKLQHIDLSVCGKLQMLPSSFGNLISLQHIDLSECPEMRMPPNSFENFTQLKYLHLTGCKQFSISIETLEKITTFEDLSLSRGFSLSTVPHQLAYSRFLRRLCLDFEFKEWPGDIRNLSNLKTLELKSSCLESLPPSLGDLRSLKELTLAYCSLECVRDSIRMLTVQLERLTIARIKDLEVVEIKECPSVETTTNSRKLEALPATLKFLRIEDCDRLVKVRALPATLREFSIDRCSELEEVPSRETLQSLVVLGWSECPKVKQWKQLGSWGTRRKRSRREWRVVSRQRFSLNSGKDF